jgi:hypothetical protein
MRITRDRLAIKIPGLIQGEATGPLAIRMLILALVGRLIAGIVLAGLGLWALSRLPWVAALGLVRESRQTRANVQKTPTDF